MSSLAEFKAALRMRDLIETLVRKELDRVRPQYSYAVVETIDREQRRATVTFGDEPLPVPVKMGSIQPKEVGQVVRVDGLKGDRFISDVMGDVVFPGFLDLQSGFTDVQSQVNDSIIVPVTSSTRPADPYVGQGIYETDTERVLWWNGSNWWRRGMHVDMTAARSGSSFTGANEREAEPWIQGGSHVGTTSAAGGITVGFPSSFPNGVMTVVASNGDSGAGGGDEVTADTITLSNFAARWYQPNGSVRTGAPRRTNWIAIGW